MSNIPVGKFAALCLNQYKHEVPQIGKVLKVSDDQVDIEWIVGTFSSVWIPWMTKGKKMNVTVHRNVVIVSAIELSKSNRLKKEDILALKRIYSNCEFL